MTENNKFIVMKFGGSSQCLHGMQVICSKISNYLKFNKKVILVISAVGKTTNHLYEITDFIEESYQKIYNTHKQLCQSIDIDFDPIKELLTMLENDVIQYRTMPFVDLIQLKLKIISWGEILASKIVWSYLNKNNVNCQYLKAHSFIKVDNFASNIDRDTLNIKGDFFCDKQVLLNMLGSFNVFVTQGFIATTIDNAYCVLTRSGSNTSASLIANAVNAEKLEIYTDVSGIFTGDPRKITNTKVIPYANYEFCLEASSNGTNVIHPFSIRPCMDKNIPIHIKNTFDPLSTGTIITNQHNIETYLISLQTNVTIFKIHSMNMSEGYGFMADIFGVFEKEKIDVNIVTSSQFEITTTTNEKNTTKIERARLQLLKGHVHDNDYKYKVDVIPNCAIVSIIANDVLHNKKIDKARRLVLKNEIKPIHISVPSSNNLAWSFVVDEQNCQLLANILHEYLISGQNVNKKIGDDIDNNIKRKSKKRKSNELNGSDNFNLNKFKKLTNK